MQKKLLITLLTIMLIITLTLTLQVSFVNASPVTFNMDTLPENQGWTVAKTGNATSYVSNGILTIDNNGDGSLTYTAPADWSNTVNFTKGWIVEFRMKLEQGSSYIWLTINDNLISPIILLTNSFLEYAQSHTYFMNTTDNFHVYRFIAQGSYFRIFVDEKLVLDIPYAEAVTHEASKTINILNGGIKKSYWDYISYDTNPNETFLTSPALTVVNGTSSYYISNLTGITVNNSPIALTNGIYAGWCVDKSTVMIRNVTHNVELYPSINASLPASQGMGGISFYGLRAVNYILNHKQGSIQEIQNAIWYFVPDQTSPSLNETNTWNMINAANANPNYVPSKGEIMAIIAYAGHSSGTSTSGSGVQNTIIEYRIP